MSKNGFWRGQEDYLRGNQLYEKKLGIIGYGRIGSNVSKFSRSFGMKITSYDPYKIEYLKKIKIYSSLDKLIKNSDVILISVHLNKKTKNLVDKKFLKKMKKNASLINVSRGEIINENDLLKCLKKRLIKSAHVDVIRNEQDIDLCDHKMIEYSRHNDNLIITPHMAGLTHESENIAAKIILDQLKNVEKKDNLPDISIIVCSYNHVAWIERCIRSLLNQNYIKKSNYEIILVNDNSKDETKKLLKNFTDIFNLKIITNKKNLGLPKSLNKAIKVSTGRYIVRVDSDDYVSRNFLFLMKLF